MHPATVGAPTSIPRWVELGLADGAYAATMPRKLVPTVGLVVVTALAAACTGRPGEVSSPMAAPTASGTPIVDGTNLAAEPGPSPSPSLTSPSPMAIASPSPLRTPEPVLHPVDGERIVARARLLSHDIGIRVAGTSADAVARTVVGAWFAQAGWAVTEEEFALPQGGTSANVVARWPGREDEDVHVVVGAHLDTVAGSPGANDNASGVATVVELARELADEAAALPVPVVLVAFGAEELQEGTGVHHVGSQAYVDAHGTDVIAALSIDMVGHGPRTCICWLALGPDTLAQRLRALAGEDFAVELRGDISDHGPFARAGIPAAFLWSYDDGRLHTPADVAEHLQPAAVARAGDLTLALLRGLVLTDADGLGPAGP